MGPISATPNYGPVGLSEPWIRRQLRFRLKKRATTATRAMIFFQISNFFNQNSQKGVSGFIF
jgi:hypothetical protein